MTSLNQNAAQVSVWLLADIMKDITFCLVQVTTVVIDMNLFYSVTDIRSLLGPTITVDMFSPGISLYGVLLYYVSYLVSPFYQLIS